MPDQAKDSIRLQLEAALRNDSEGVERDAVLRRLEQSAIDIRSKMDAGVPPDEFAQLERVHLSLTAGIKVVEVVWRRSHRV